jgi:hypothetical protein
MKNPTLYKETEMETTTTSTPTESTESKDSNTVFTAKNAAIAGGITIGTVITVLFVRNRVKKMKENMATELAAWEAMATVNPTTPTEN